MRIYFPSPPQVFPKLWKIYPTRSHRGTLRLYHRHKRHILHLDKWGDAGDAAARQDHGATRKMHRGVCGHACYEHARAVEDAVSGRI